MWLEPVVTSAPASYAIDLEEAKAALRIDDDDQDQLVERYMAAATAQVERQTGTRLITQTLTLRTDDWADLANLPVAPVQSVTSITYVDVDGATQTLATTVYEARLYGLEPGIVLKFNQTWPTIRVGSLIVVTVVAGYGDTYTLGTTAAPVVQAVALLVADMYAFRETAQVGSVSGAIATSAPVEALLANYTKHLI